MFSFFISNFLFQARISFEEEAPTRRRFLVCSCGNFSGLSGLEKFSMSRCLATVPFNDFLFVANPSTRAEMPFSFPPSSSQRPSQGAPTRQFAPWRFVKLILSRFTLISRKPFRSFYAPFVRPLRVFERHSGRNHGKKLFWTFCEYS